MIQNNDEVISVGEWVGIRFLSIIPFVSIIMLLIFSFGGNTNKNVSNWAKAQLIFTGFLIILTVIVVLVIL